YRDYLLGQRHKPPGAGRGPGTVDALIGRAPRREAPGKRGMAPVQVRWYDSGPMEAVTMVEVLRRLFGSTPPDPAVRQLVGEIEGFRTLGPGWNSYRAPRISDVAIDAALALI